MNYYRQLTTVILWEYRRFYKIKNELIGIFVMLILFVVGFYGGNFVVKSIDETQEIFILEDSSPELFSVLSQKYSAIPVTQKQADSLKTEIGQTKEGVLLWEDQQFITLFAYKKPPRFSALQEQFNLYVQQNTLSEKGLTQTDLKEILAPVTIKTEYIYENIKGKSSTTALFFAGIMVMVVFLSFAYQFTAITGEKQLKITEQIVSAIKPQIWMDGKILGITLTALSSMVTWIILSILGGMVFFLLTDTPVSRIWEYIDLPGLAIYFPFTIVGILLWNSLMAGVASIITDPNNSGKGSLMMLPVLFVLASAVVLLDPDNQVAIFLSWFPLTSATGMPMRWVATNLPWWEVAGSFVLLATTFYFMRKLAAKIFRVSILISGKEPSWGEVLKLARES